MLYQLETNGGPQIRTDVLVRFPENDRKPGDLGGVAKAGKLLQCQLRFGWQAAELADHEVQDIVSETLGIDAIEIAGPARRVMIKVKQILIGQRVKKLNHKERIARRLVMHELRQRLGTFWLAA